MSIEDDIAFLESVPALALLGRDALRIIAIGAESRYVHDGAVLFFEGEAADAAFVVQEGSFDLVAEANPITPSTVVLAHPYRRDGAVVETSAGSPRRRASLHGVALPRSCSSRC